MDEDLENGGLEAGDGPTPRMQAWARNSAAYRLARRMMTEKELGDAIARKAQEKFHAITLQQVRTLVDIALAFGREMKALDDVSYAEIRSRASQRAGKSRRLIARKLMEKGIDRETVTTVLEEADDLVSGVIFARKRGFGPFRRTDLDDRQRRRELAAFARNGYGFDLACRIADMTAEEAEDILSEASP
ncbi:regulatory protein RecX (plasmid) [Peteryoungia desertarenae]|uniref:Regulatory protein RecX n=1 Tax=Peteryoungia desertarenae TaxID=1813451 RepID=A0ABX6QTX6_9HYPH|nr:regulatory protein RecX [Peteryoungia desertarenae]QLF71908.1 regulatory protein RecX [Peteryoungia desertarenae]